MIMEYRKFSTFIDSVQYGYTATETSMDKGDAKYLRITDIVPYFVDKDRVPFCKIDNKNKVKYLVSENDLLIARTGATTGYNLIVPKGFKNYIFASYLVRFNYKQNKLHPKYLKHVLKSQQYYGFVKNYIGGSAQPGMNPRAFGKFEVPYVEYEIQEQIADVLSVYDDLIENNNKRIALLEKAAQELYKEWFVRFRFPGHEKSKFINGLPEGWERKKISECYNTSSGGTPSRSNEQFYINGKYPWIKTGEVKDTIIIDTEEYITEDAVKQSSAKLIPAKSVIMAMYGVNIGMLGYVDREMTCNQACCVFADKREFSTRHYLYQYLMSIREYLLLISFGAAQQNVSQDLIKKIKIVMPTNDVVIEYEKKIDTIYNSIRSLLYKNKNLIKQRDLLLPRLMSGKLEV